MFDCPYYDFGGDIFLLIKAPMNTSSKLNGTTINNIPEGSIPIIQRTIQSITKEINQDNKVVYKRLNFLEIANIVMARKKPHIIQKIPVTGSVGKVICKFS